jgi:hypothetical protein
MLRFSIRSIEKSSRFTDITRVEGLLIQLINHLKNQATAKLKTSEKMFGLRRKFEGQQPLSQRPPQAALYCGLSSWSATPEMTHAVSTSIMISAQRTASSPNSPIGQETGVPFDTYSNNANVSRDGYVHAVLTLFIFATVHGQQLQCMSLSVRC